MWYNLVHPGGDLMLHHATTHKYSFLSRGLPMQTSMPIADTLRIALEQSNAGLLTSLYADDAELCIVDRNRPPSSPLEIRGKDAISKFYEDICGRAMTHKIDDQIVGNDRIAFTETCQYPDGKKVVCAAMLHLQDGKIVRQVTVQAWDEH